MKRKSARVDETYLFYGNEQEGYVVRNAAAFRFAELETNVAKYVRTDHVRTTKHWKRAAVVANQLAARAALF